MGAEHKGRRGRPWRRKREIFRRMCERSNAPCALCGQAIDYRLAWPDPMSFTADHIVPWSKLPPGDRRRDSTSNLQPVHARCNSSKGNRVAKIEPAPESTDPAPWDW